MKFDEIYKKVIDACYAYKKRQIPIFLDFNIEDLHEAVIEAHDTIEKLKEENKRLNRALYKALANWARNAKFIYEDEYSMWLNMEQKCIKKAEEYK